MFALQLPGSSAAQYMSVASGQAFPDDIEAIIERLQGVFSLALYGAYRTSQAMELAKTYVGHSTGPRVLQGAIARGAAETLHAGIMFCDVRGFTAMSERLSGEGVVRVMNELFQVVGEEAESRGGEILKFIGDAMLIVFSINGGNEAAVASAMVDTVRAAAEGVEEVSQRLEEELSIGFGCHLGDVVYGNIGTTRRLDFTVMGSAVNLASRLEGLTKELGVRAVFSGGVSNHVPSLKCAGKFALKGVSDPVGAFVMDD